MLYIPKMTKINERHPVFDPCDTGENLDYQVKINGQDCPVHSCRVSAMPFDTLWPGRQRDKSQTEWASYINFFGDETVTVEVVCRRSFEKTVVRPLSKGIATEVHDNTVTFTLTENGKYVFELDDSHFALHIFYNAPKAFPKPEDVTYYFGPGIHNPLLLHLKDNETVFVHPEAIVYTTVYASGAENIRVFGGGVLDNSCQERIDDRCHNAFPIGNIRMANTNKIRIEDVILLNSANWVCSFFGCNDVIIDNIKIVGQWRYNTDGIDATNTSNVKIKNCFIRAFDDVICVKAINEFCVCENVEVENCVCWCDWGKTFELGLETATDTLRNVSFTNCDLIHNTAGVMAISNGHYADLYNISYENINVEYQSYNRRQIYQDTEDMQFAESAYMADLLRIDNTKFNALYYSDLAGEKDKKFGHNHNIFYKNICVYTDTGMDKPKLVFNSHSADSPVEDVRIEGISVNGVPVEDVDDFTLKANNARNIFLNGKKIL